MYDKVNDAGVLLFLINVKYIAIIILYLNKVIKIKSKWRTKKKSVMFNYKI